MELGQYRRFRNDSEKLGTLTYRNKSQQIVVAGLMTGLGQTAKILGQAETSALRLIATRPRTSPQTHLAGLMSKRLIAPLAR